MLCKIDLVSQDTYEQYKLSKSYVFINITPIWKYFYENKVLDKNKIFQANALVTRSIEKYVTDKGGVFFGKYIAKSPSKPTLYLIPIPLPIWNDDTLSDLNKLCVSIYNQNRGKSNPKIDYTDKNISFAQSNEIYKKMMSEISTQKTLDIGWLDYTTGTEKTLYPHQIEAVNFVMERKYALLDLITGSGKTLISLVCAKNIQRLNPKPILVVCEKKAIPMWEEECLACGVKAEFTNYEQLQKRIKKIARGRGYQYLPNPEFDSNIYSAIIIDESHNLSNYTIAGKSLLAYTKDFDGYILSLTATPYKNTLTDYFYHFDLLKHPVGEFSKTDYGLVVLPAGKPNIERFTDISKNLIITRTYKDINLNIPIRFKKVNIEIDEKDPFWEEYAEIKKNAREMVVESGNRKLVINSAIMNLRKACAVMKKKYTKELVDKYINRKCIVISSYNNDVLDDLGEVFDTEVYKATNKNKENIYKDFVEGDSNVFLAQRRISETSLNLQVADTLIYNDLWYSLSSFVQANGRIKRIGSPYEELFVYIPIIKGTVEESVFNILIRKYSEREAVVEGLKGVEQKIYQAEKNQSANREIQRAVEDDLGV